MSVPPVYGMVLAAILFVIGLGGLLIRRNMVFVVISVEVMLNAGGLGFISAGARWAQADGQAVFLFLLAVAAAEAAIGLALILWLHHRHRTVDSDSARQMRG
ncbi:MAG TPA: NADH-quinone oxidoreductase subunit NuoK [Spirochaetia bacterium]|nr:NADH-quinone oxidoreductase subunit NuoK [Spirochaetia bacterium]